MFKYFQVVALLISFCTTLALEDGQKIFAFAIGIIAANVALHVFRSGELLKFIVFWQLGFLLIIAYEGVFFESLYAGYYRPEHYNGAARYINGANFLFLIFYYFFEKDPVADGSKRMIASLRVNAGLGMFFILAAYVLFLAVHVPLAYAMASGGRLAGGEAIEFMESVGGFEAPLRGLARCAGLVLPAMLMYHYLWAAPSQSRLLKACTAIAPILVIQFLIGIRFPLLFGILGALVVYSDSVKVQRKQFVQLFACLLVLVFAFQAMKTFRRHGFSNVSVATIAESFRPTEFTKVDYVVLTMSKIVDYFEVGDHLHGRSNAALVFFWIPRYFWPNKPTLLDHWFIREYGDRGISESHSSSSTFASNAFVDFGFWGGISFWGLMGWPFAKLQTWCDKVRARRGDGLIILVAVIFPASFFGVRSFDSALILMSGVILFIVGYRIFLNYRGLTRASSSGEQRSSNVLRA